MLTRRIERRMSLSHFNQIAEYLAFLREHPEEVKLLFRDLLIGVTNFFRDPEAFHALETEVIAPLVHTKEPDAHCASGAQAAPPVRSLIRWPCCCWSSWQRLVKVAKYKSSPLTSMMAT